MNLPKLLTLTLISTPLWSQSASITTRHGTTISAWVEDDPYSQTPSKTICFMNSGKHNVEIEWALHGMANVDDTGKGTVTVKPLPHKQSLVRLRPIDKAKPMGVATLTIAIVEQTRAY